MKIPVINGLCVLNAQGLAIVRAFVMVIVLLMVFGVRSIIGLRYRERKGNDLSPRNSQCSVFSKQPL